VRVVRAAPAPAAIKARWPGAEQIFLIERYRHPRTKAMGDISACHAGRAGRDGRYAGQALLTCAAQLGAKVSCEAVTGIISLPARRAGPADLLTFNRSHWGIENGLHHRRDTTYGEDASTVRAGTAPRLLAGGSHGDRRTRRRHQRGESACRVAQPCSVHHSCGPCTAVQRFGRGLCACSGRTAQWR